MSSGGMDWAYRMIASHDFTSLEVAIVLHLGWRDHPDFRTIKGIARALARDRNNVRDAVARLVGRGVLALRSGSFVACETVAIVEESAAALLPSAGAADASGGGSVAPLVPEKAGGSVAPRVGGPRPPLRGVCGPPKEKENLRSAALPDFASLSEWKKTCFREGKPVLGLSGPALRAASAAFIAWERAA